MVSRVWFWLILPIAICLFPAAGLGQAKSRLSLDIVCDQPSHLFTVGEPATLTVRISNPGPQVAATFRYWIDDAVEGEVKSEQRELTIPAGQTISQSIMIPSDRKGSFRARLDLESADETISQTFPFAITSPPLPSQPLATSRFGISSYLPYYPQRADAKMAVLAQAGARWIRFPFLWGEIEPAQGEFDWAKYDELVGMVAKHGLQILGTLCYCAPWAALDPQTRRLGSDLLSPPKDPTQFASFVARVVERYKGSIHHWEIWNEPNSDWGYGKSRIGEYRELLEAAYRAAKQSDPNCQVLMGGLGGADLDYLKRLCSWEGGNPFDLLNVHTYLAPRPPDLGQLPSSINFGLSLEQTFQELESLAARLHLPRSIWLSEMGWATFSGDRGSSEMEQANHLARAYLIAWAAGFDKVFWHSGFDLMPNRPEEREQDTWDQHTGILRTDFTPKPAYLAYQTVSSQLEGAKFIRQLELPDYLRGLVFQVKNQPIVAIWSVAGQVTLGMNMKMEGKSILMTDLMGNLSQLEPMQGKCVLTLDESPLFLQGCRDIKLLPPFARFTQKSINISPKAQRRVYLRLTNPFGKKIRVAVATWMSGVPAAQALRQEVELKKKEIRDLAIIALASPSARSGTHYIIYADISLEEKRIGKLWTKVNIVSAISAR